MRRRTAVKVASGAAAIVMATASAGWGDAPDEGVPVGDEVLLGYAEPAKLTITNAAAPGAGDIGTCELTDFVDAACARQLTVTGTNITNTIEPKTVDAVELWWFDEPFAALARRQPDGPVEDNIGKLCKTLGVRLTPESAPVTVTGGSLTATVTAPPRAETTEGGTARPVQAYYGVNAVCATWDDHEVGGFSHVSATAGTYTIRPAL